PGALKALPDLQHARFDASLRHPTWPSTTEGGDILPRMRWVAPPAKDAATATLEKRLWAAADQLRANSGLTSAQYSQPVLGLIFLRFAEVRFAVQRAKLEKVSASSRRGSRVDDPTAYHADGVLYLTPNSRFAYLRDLNCSTSGPSFPKRGLVHWTNPSSTGAARQKFKRASD